MGFNCAQEKAKFDREWLRLRKEYTDAGMSETAIQKIYEYDWYCFCRNRAYERRATQMPSLEIDSPDDERRSALFRKNEALSTSFDESAFPDRYAWVDTLEDERLLRAIIKLNKKDLELLTYVTLEGHGQEELARRWGCTQAAVAIRMKKIKKICAYRLYAVERKIDTKVRNIGQQKCYNDLRKRRRSLAWHEQRASRLKNFALVSARKRAAGRNYSGFGFQTALSARNAAVRNITQFAGGTRSSAVPADTRLPSPQKPLCTARICP